jgi:hypothetical protein
MLARILAVAFASCLVFAAPSMASTDADATAHVAITVDPHVGVQGPSGDVEMGTVQWGDWCWQIPFYIHANFPQVNIWVEATNLYFADIPGAPVPPIPLYGDGVRVIDAVGSQFDPLAGGYDWFLPWRGTPYDIVDGFMGYKTYGQDYQSSLPCTFSHDLLLEVCWIHEIQELAMGEFSGFVIIHVSMI